MNNRSNLVPPPRWAFLRWLVAPIRPLDSEAQGELRAGMFRRTDALIAGSAVSGAISVICYVQKPISLFFYWLAIDLTLNIARVLVLLAFRRDLKNIARINVSPLVVDGFIVMTTIWSAQVGLASALYIAMGDPVTGIFGSLLAVSVIGAHSARNPASPRLMRLQMSIVILPFAFSALLSPIPALHWMPLLSIPYLFGMISINTELHADYVAMIEAQIENRRRALHCSLTGLPNRAFFQQNVTAALDHARFDKPVAILCMDLDGFKAVNDALGHPIGDILLQAVARRIGSIVPGTSMPARTGGDEFAVLMPYEDRAECEALARSLIASICRPYTLGSDVVEIGVSIGIAAGGHDATETFDRLFESADRALYAAKRAGRGVFRWYDNVLSIPTELETSQASDRSGTMRAA